MYAVIITDSLKKNTYFKRGEGYGKKNKGKMETDTFWYAGEKKAHRKKYDDQ